MKEKRQIIGKQQFRAQFDKNSINVDNRTVNIVFVTERQVMMYNWDIGSFFEILPCTADSGDLSRLNNGAPLCDSHMTYTVRNGLGVVERAWFEDNVGRATVRFSKRQEVEPIWQDVVDGILTGVSVGYRVYEYEEIGLKDNLPVIRANKWEGTEISLALVQADPDSVVERSKKANENYETILIRNFKKSIMTDAEKAALKAERKRSADIFRACRSAGLSDEYAQELIESDLTFEDAQVALNARVRQQPSLTVQSSTVDTDGRKEGVKEERTRIAEIMKAGRILNLEASFVQDLVDNGTPLDAARKLILDEGARLNPVRPRLTSGISIGADEKDKKARGMASAIMIRSEIVKPEIAGDPGEYRGMTLMDLAKECLSDAGIRYRGMSAFEIAGRALSMQTRDGGGGISSGDFSYILLNVMNKTLRQAYELQGRTFTTWARKSTASDFKNILRTQLSDIKLTKVQEGGEYSFATISDSGETYKVAKYGKIVNIDWEAIVNDDLSAFSRVPTLLAGAVAQMQGDLMYSILTGAETMGDGNPLFDAANHKNLTTVGTDISVDSLGVGRKQFRQQISPGGSPLNLAPKFLVVGPNKEQLALQYTSQNFVATKSTDQNIWAGLLQPVVDARITGNAWYLIADPSQIDTAEYATLEGQEIFTEAKYGFDVDALQYKIRSVFGKKAIEWRAFYKNAGV